jgi:hypothetical protein
LNEFSDGVDFNLFWLILRAPTGLGDISRMFPHRFPFTSFRASAVGYDLSSLMGLARGWQNLWDEFSGGADFNLFWLVLCAPAGLGAQREPG